MTEFKSHRDMTLFMIPKLPSFRGQRTWAQEGGGRGTENSILDTDTILHSKVAYNIQKMYLKKCFTPESDGG